MSEPRRTPPILALRGALYALAGVLGVWALSHVLIGGALVWLLYHRCAPPPALAVPSSKPPAPAHEPYPPRRFDYPL